MTRGRKHPFLRKWFLSRKFLGTVGIFVTATVALFKGVLDGPSWAIVVGLVMTAFIGGEVVQKNITGGPGE